MLRLTSRCPTQRITATVSVQATQSEKYPTRFFRDRLKECQLFIESLGRALNYTLLAVPIHVVLESMHPSADENDES